MEPLFKPHPQQVAAAARRKAVRETALRLLASAKTISTHQVHEALPDSALPMTAANCANILRVLSGQNVLMRVPRVPGYFQLPPAKIVIGPRLYQSDFIRAANPAKAVARR